MLLKSYNDLYNELKQLREHTETDCTTKLTEMQCKERRKDNVNYVKNNINGHYVKWSGTVEDVKRDLAYVKYTEYINNSTTIMNVIPLHDISKDKLLKLNKGELITFIGKIGELDKGFGGSGGQDFVIVPNWENLNLYNVEILEYDK